MKILLIVPPERFDIYNYLDEAEGVEWVLLWYEKASQMTLQLEHLPLKFSKIVYWTEFATPRQLLKELQPDRIVFFEILDLRQIALIVTASKHKVTTFYLEHGAAGDRNTAISRWEEISFSAHKLPYLFKRFIGSFRDVVKAKFFYYSVRSGFRTKDSYKKYISLPFKMLRDGPNKVLSHNHFRERVPNKSIVFNQANFDEYTLYAGISKEDALFTGVPYFDKYYRSYIEEKEYIVYIDHPYFEEKLAGWSREHFEKVANTLFDFAHRKKVLAYIKLHPRSNKALWEELNFNSEYVRIVQAGDFTELYSQAKLILGFSSSLINGFLCARKNVVLLGWHPQPHIFGADFSQTGLCHVSYACEELFESFEYWSCNNLALKNEPAYEHFLYQFNYPFDGKATERVINALTKHEVS